MAIVNRKLIPHKVLLFCIFGALGCIWPYLTHHMLNLGMNREEIAIINLVVPFTSLLGAPLAGLLGFKTGRHKLVLVTTLVLSAIAFSALLTTPTVVRFPATLPRIEFECHGSASSSASIFVERCESNCMVPHGGASTIGLRDCHYICHSEGVKGTGGPYRKSASDLPHICMKEQGSPGICHVYNVSGTGEDIVLTAPVSLVTTEDSSNCHYALTQALRDDVEVPSVTCRYGDAQSRGRCVLKCHGFIMDENQDAMALHRCEHIKGHPLITFGVYLFIRIVAEFFLYASFGLIDATIFHGCWQHSGFFSRQFFWGLLPLALISPSVGYIMDSLYDYTDVELIPFISFDIMILATVIAIIVLPIRITDYINKCGSFAGKILLSCEAVTFLIGMLCLGVFFGFMETFFYVFLAEMDGTPTSFGLTITAGVLPALPFIFFGDILVRRLGHANLLITGLFAYTARFTALSFMNDSRWLPWVLLFEPLEIFSYYLAWVAAMTYSEKLGPKIIATTITATAAIMHNNFGRGIGALFGGYLMHVYGTLFSFRVMAVLSGCFGLIYMALYHFYIKARRSPIYIESSTNGHWTPMETYSNGESQDVKPMLKEKKPEKY